MRIEVKQRNYTGYPYLGRVAEKIVFFSAPRTGVVVSDDSGQDKVGTYSEEWNERAFTHFYGTLSMSNEP